MIISCGSPFSSVIRNFRCLWRGRPCSAANFTSSYSDLDGYCHTFNGDRHNILKSLNAGPTHGLELILNVEQYEYMSGPWNTAGIKVIVHNQTEVVAIEDMGSDVAPGLLANVGVQVIKVPPSSPPPFLLDRERSVIVMYSSETRTEMRQSDPSVLQRFRLHEFRL